MEEQKEDDTNHTEFRLDDEMKQELQQKQGTGLFSRIQTGASGILTKVRENQTVLKAKEKLENSGVTAFVNKAVTTIGEKGGQAKVYAAEKANSLNERMNESENFSKVKETTRSGVSSITKAVGGGISTLMAKVQKKKPVEYVEEDLLQENDSSEISSDQSLQTKSSG